MCVPVYRIPSVLLQGEEATSWGIVNGNFFNAESNPPRPDPSM